MSIVPATNIAWPSKFTIVLIIHSKQKRIILSLRIQVCYFRKGLHQLNPLLTVGAQTNPVRSWGFLGNMNLKDFRLTKWSRNANTQTIMQEAVSQAHLIKLFQIGGFNPNKICANQSCSSYLPSFWLNILQNSLFNHPLENKRNILKPSKTTTVPILLKFKSSRLRKGVWKVFKFCHVLKSSGPYNRYDIVINGVVGPQ